MDIDLRKYPVLFSKTKCEALGIDTSELYESRIMQGVCYATDKSDFEKKERLAETAIIRSVKESFLITKPHLVNRVLKRIDDMHGNVDKRFDAFPVRTICNRMVNRGVVFEFSIPLVDGGTFSVVGHGDHKADLDRIIEFVLECLEKDDGLRLSQLRKWIKIREIIELDLAQKSPEDWDQFILSRLNYVGLIQLESNNRIVTPLGAFP